MKRIIADVRAFGVQFMRSRIGAFFAIAFPIILILLFGAIFSGGSSTKVPIYVQDLSDTPLSANFAAALNATTVLEVRSIPKTIDISEYIRQHSINTALSIPIDFSPKVLANETVNVTLYGDPTQSSYGIAYAAVNGAATQFNFAVARVKPVVIPTTHTIAAQDLRFIDLFLPGVIGLTVLTNPLFGMTNVCAEYRTRKFFKFLATTRLSKGEWLASKIIWYSFLMLVSTAIMFAVERLVFGGSAVITPVAILLILAGTFQFTSLGMILGLYVRDTETAAAVANAIGFPMMFLAGSFFPVDTMPPALEALARVLPHTYINGGLRATIVFNKHSTALLYLGITEVIGIVLFIIPAKALSWKST